VNPTPGDKRLTGMGNVRPSTEAGMGIGYGPLMVVARLSVSLRGPKGAQVDMTVEMPWSLSDRFSLRFALGATWANRDYMQTYFGVTAAQAQATSFSMYTPKSGCRKVMPVSVPSTPWHRAGNCKPTLAYHSLVTMLPRVRSSAGARCIGGAGGGL